MLRFLFPAVLVWARVGTTSRVASHLHVGRRLQDAASNSTCRPGGAAGLPEPSVALCLIVRDQPAYLQEWIDWHLALGVQKIYVFDHNSTTPLLDGLLELVREGRVAYRFFTTEHRARSPVRYPQNWAYETCLREYGALHHFMGFIDADEFIMLRGADHTFSSEGLPQLPAFLAQYQGCGGLVVNWRLFGSSGHIDRPAGGLLASYTSCLEDDHEENRHVKTIANTALTRGTSPDPHHFLYTPPAYAVNEDFQPVHGPRSASVSNSRIVLHHYATLSQQDFQEKLRRGSSHGTGKTMHFWDHIQQSSTQECADAVGFSKLLPRRSSRLRPARPSA